MSPLLRARIGAVLLAATEAYLLLRYARLGTELHYVLHLLHGAAFGLGTWVLIGLVRPRHRPPEEERQAALTAAYTGHLFAAVPDIAFIAAGALHVRWMDVFAVHIRIHMVPQALWVTWGMMLTAVVAWLALRAGRRAVAAGAMVLLMATVTGALILAPPIPETVAEVRALADEGLWCPLLLPSE